MPLIDRPLSDKRPFTGWEAQAVVAHILAACDDDTLPLTINEPPPGPGTPCSTDLSTTGMFY